MRLGIKKGIWLRVEYEGILKETFLRKSGESKEPVKRKLTNHWSASRRREERV